MLDIIVAIKALMKDDTAVELQYDVVTSVLTITKTQNRFVIEVTEPEMLSTLNDIFSVYFSSKSTWRYHTFNIRT